MEVWQHYHHCPRCGQAQELAPSPAEKPADLELGHEQAWPPPFKCQKCRFTLYFNPICAVGVFVRRQDGKMLFIRRGREPGKGKLAPPGGFIDLGETAEHAAHREIREEVGLEIARLEYIGSWPNRYPGADFIINVLDFFFIAEAVTENVSAMDGEVEGHEWLDPLEVMATDLAFTSMHHAHRALQARLRS